MKVSKEAVKVIAQLRKDGFELDFSRQGMTPCTMDFCRADDGTQAWIVYADGACLHPSVDYFEEMDRLEEEYAMIA